MGIPFNEDFSGLNFLHRWKVGNIDNDITWEARNLNGGATVTVQNHGYVGASILGQVDDLISPPLDFSNSSKTEMFIEFPQFEQNSVCFTSKLSQELHFTL